MNSFNCIFFYLIQDEENSKADEVEAAPVIPQEPSGIVSPVLQFKEEYRKKVQEKRKN